MFVYSGPKDSRNRTFCAHHVNRTFTVAESGKIQNRRMQEYNCRHTIIPFSGNKKQFKKRRGTVKV